MIKKSVDQRELVLGILTEVTEHGMYSHIVLRDVLDKYQYLNKKERAFITRVTEGTLEHMLELDYIIDWFSSVKGKKMKPVIRNILRMSVYQLKYMDSVPDSAVCSEAVRLAGKKGFSGLKGFVNGVLRNIARKGGQVRLPEDPLKWLSVKYSMPEWILRMWSGSMTMEEMETVVSEFQKEKPLTIRCNLSKCAPGELEEVLVREKVTVKRHPYLDYAFYISGFDHLSGLESFREGMFYVQDVSSMLVCETAAPKEGDLVIDVCAAPGGKSLHMAELLHGTGRVEARDLTEYKVDLIWENIERSGLENIEAMQQDASVPDQSSVDRADIVLADLPCSGLGVAGKKPDLKYRVQPEDIESLARLQRKILQVVQTYVKPGGTLVYSTCTISPRENMENVRWFLEKNPKFELVDIRDRVCEKLQGDIREKGCLQLLPGIHESDGFFLACMRRKKSQL